jgi:hypothetical protein
MNNNFNLKKFLAEGKLLKEVETKYGDEQVQSEGVLSKDEWNKYKAEYDQNENFNWLLRQLDILDGEEERTEYAWDFSIEEIEKEFNTEREAADVIHQIFAILKEPYNQTDYKIQTKLTNKLFQWATPKELIDINPGAWESMAWAGDYEDYVDAYKD